MRQDPIPATLSPRALRVCVAGLSVSVAVVLGWAAWVLPWRETTAFAALTAGVAACHASTVALALLGTRVWLTAWRIQSVASLGYFAYLAWSVAESAVHVGRLYGGLGRGLGIGLVAALAVVALLLVPLSLWGVARTGGVRPKRSVGVAVLLAGAGLTASLWHAHASAAARVIVPMYTPDLAAMIEARVRPPQPSLPGEPQSLFSKRVVQCARSPKDMGATVFVAFRSAATQSSAVVRCVQASDLAAALSAVDDSLAGVRGRVAFEVVTAVDELDARAVFTDPLTLRPGLDAACVQGRCFTAWQLIAQEAFLANRPLRVVPELRFGVDPEWLHAALNASSGAEVATFAGIDRLEVASFVRGDDGRVVALDRGREPVEATTREALEAAEQAAEAHVVAALGQDGRFRYQLEPFSGHVSYRGFALPRQAGTTMALCDVGRRTPEVDKAALQALEMMASLRQPAGEGAALTFPAGRRRAALGSTALPLIAFATCRDRAGSRYDALMAEMARFLLQMQRPDGGFHPTFSLRDHEVIQGPDPLFAGGQVIFALVLVEQLAQAHPAAGFPPAEEIAGAIDRAMAHFTSTHYWPAFLGDFLFLEENWHCLAARAAIESHPNTNYEQFCLDYVDFKHRLILDGEARVRADLVGGYGFGNVLLPHNTATAGFGETLAAAMAVRVARGSERQRDHEAMQQVLRYLLQQQWNEAACFACTDEQHVAGAFSEHPGSPEIRIDYVQHAWSALGNGRRMLYQPRGEASS